MYILSYKEGHDPSACLLKNGEIIAAVEEERITRQKHAPSVFPKESIKFCLNFANIKQKDVNCLVYARLKPWQTFLKVINYYLIHPPKTKTELRYFISHLKVQIAGTCQEFLGKANYQKIHQFFPELPKKIYSFDHHFCHAASAYYFSEFDNSLIITMDGKGEATSVMIARGDGEKIKILERRGVFQSLGLFYSSLTKYLGFTPNDGEYKVMGLAPYGKLEIDFKNILKSDDKKGYKINPDFGLYPLSLKNWQKKFGPARNKNDEIKDFHKNLACSAQKAFEQAGLDLLKYALKKIRTAEPCTIKVRDKNLCLAGGVALNVKMNKVFWESGLIDNIFVQPAAGDNGLVLGACALLYHKLTGRRVKPLRNLYLGPGYSEDEVKEVLDSHRLEITKYNYDSLIEKTAELLASGKVVGWFQGRMEFGPRALGNRSILAHPGIAEMKDLVNKKIKFRESFRPFCPSILKEFGPLYFKNYIEAPYMIMSFVVLDDKIKEKIPAVVHVDNTVRPQTVDEKINPLYYKLIKKFYQKTGIPALLNTSMNVRGEPIVCSPQDAINFLLKTNVDAMVIRNSLVVR